MREKENALKEIIPKLSHYYKSNKESPKVSILQGIDSATIILEEMFETKKEILWILPLDLIKSHFIFQSLGKKYFIPLTYQLGFWFAAFI